VWLWHLKLKETIMNCKQGISIIKTIMTAHRNRYTRCNLIKSTKIIILFNFFLLPTLMLSPTFALYLGLPDSQIALGIFKTSKAAIFTMTPLQHRGALK